MRKKYLSALLFGALLVTSAGTFTSCKDYDDDINNLQGQIDKVVADLESLKTTVENLGGVTDVKIEGGKLLVSTADGETVSYDFPKDEAGDVEKTVVELDGQDLKVDGKVIGQVGDKVTVNEEGYLCVNGDPTEIKAGKYAVLENSSDNTYTISLPDKDGNMQTITLLKAVPANIKIVLTANARSSSSSTNDLCLITEEDAYTAATTSTTSQFTSVNTETGKGLYWGKAEKDIEWANIKKDQLLIGQMNEIEITVTPANTELDKQSLKLVDSEGKFAPVTVNVVPQNQSVENSGSRAVAKAGGWILTVAMTEEVTVDNIETAFATMINNTWKNKKYALSVNGSVASDYNIVIDTRIEDTEIDRDDDITVATGKVTVGGEKMGRFSNLEVSGSDTPLSNGFSPAKLVQSSLQQISFDLNKSYTLAYVDPQIASYKFEIYDGDVEDAKLWGISIENNKIIATDAAADKTVRVAVTLLTVNGKEVKDATKYCAIKFGKTEVDPGEISPVEYTVPAKSLADGKSYIGIDLGSTFSGLTSEQATSLNNVTWTVEGDDKFIIAKSDLTDAIKFFANATDAADDTKAIKTNDQATQVKKITYAKIALNGTLNSAAEVGTYNLILTLSNANGEIKKVKVPVTIKVPGFDQLFEQKSSVWKDGALYANIDGNGKVNMLAGYTLKQDVVLAKGLKLTFSEVKNSAGDDVLGVQAKSEGSGLGAFADKTLTIDDDQNHSIKIAADAIDNNKLLVLQATPSYKVQGIYEVKGTKFNINLVTALDNAKIVYYVDGAEQTPMELTANGSEITYDNFTPASGDTKKKGIALVVGNTDYTLKGNINGMLNLSSATWESEFGEAVPAGATASVESNGSLKVKIASPTTGSYTSTLTFKVPSVTVDGSNKLYKEMTINIKVK